MASPALPSLALRRTTTTILPRSAITTSSSSSTSSTSPFSPICQQCRHASLIRRPKRPYTFTQLVTLTDGSTFLQRTTSPQPVYKTTKDTRNNPLWNPSSQKLLNVEEDEAGRLRAFRRRFGRGWDAEAVDEAAGEEVREGEEHLAKGTEEEEDSLLDLISGYGLQQEQQGQAKGERVTKGKGKK
ncbi:hypothetical protein L228DRAFT_243817 [Xylona heveae TC161]|uniref:Ribosomal protein bL31m N-terminal domain-containing protein n=1 Tax=Xylona heveae (strain CBS 132557 / TC161) TaxID=1328760 RepID=A0A165IKN6_XYLHT|nr:hypothetical protein L228DRAFT_243817 [Xylona heveae TC161]KZF25036.1 hypothetical protein L228DRAFT_243817 [Xylona heveae TC161]